LLAGRSAPANAAPTAGAFLINGLPANASLTVLQSASITAPYTDEGAPTFVLTSTAAATIGYFWSPAVTQNNDGQLITPTPALNPTSITVADDVDLVAEPTTVTAFFICISAGATNISYTQGGGTSVVLTITCTGAAASTITFSNAAPAVNTAVTVTGICTAPGQILTSNVAGLGTPTNNGTFVSATQVTCIAAGSLIVPYTCPATVTTVTFTLNGVTNTLACGSTATNGLVLSATTGYSATVSGTCTAGTLLTQTGPAYFAGATLNGVTITTGVAAGSVSCTTGGALVASLVCNSAGNVSIALGAATANFVCTAGYTGYNGYAGGYNPYLNNAYPTTCAGYNTAYPYNTGAYPYTYNNGAYPYNQYANIGCNQQYTNVPSSLTIASASPSVTCGGTSSVTIRVVGANGQTVADGTSVALAASVGTLSPASGSTVSGAVTATYTAPAAVPATSVTLRATAGAASNTTGVSITCASTTAPATTAPVAAPSYSPPAPPAGNLVISPPNTGDAGLLVAEMTGCGDVVS